MGYTESVLLKQLIIEIRKLNDNFSSGTGSGGGGTGDASEATLTNILSELVNSGALSSFPVTDSNDTLLIRETTIDQTTGAKVTQFIDPSTGSVVTPTFPLKTSDTSNWELLQVDLIDDVVGDESGDLINYSDFYVVLDDGTRTLLFTLDEKGQPYILQGTSKSISEIGTNLKTSAEQLVLTGGNWIPTGDITSFSYSVITVGDTNNRPCLLYTSPSPRD